MCVAALPFNAHACVCVCPPLVCVLLCVCPGSAWGGFAPNITVEFDEGTGHLLFATLRYNKRVASKCVR